MLASKVPHAVNIRRSANGERRTAVRRKGLVRGRCMSQVSARRRKKTYSAGTPRKLGPWSWNWVGVETVLGDCFPKAFCSSSKVVRETGFGAGCCQHRQRKDKKNNSLALVASPATVGSARAYRESLGAFHMAIRVESRARGKGLARHFSRIVPPASEREARMDDPTRWCENDTGN